MKYPISISVILVVITLISSHANALNTEENSVQTLTDKKSKSQNLNVLGEFLRPLYCDIMENCPEMVEPPEKQENTASDRR